MSAQAAALAAIDTAFAEPVLYTPAGLNAVQIPVVWIEAAAPSFMGAGATARQLSCEIRYELLEKRPRKADRIERADKLYQPLDVTDMDTLGRWTVTLEAAE